jgi:hypothetical protein
MSETETKTDDEITTPLCECGELAEYSSPRPLCLYCWARWYVDRTPRTPDERHRAMSAAIALVVAEIRNEVKNTEHAAAADRLGKVGATLIACFANWLDEIGKSNEGSCGGATAADLAFNVRDGDFEEWLREKQAGGAGRETGGGPPSGSGSVP